MIEQIDDQQTKTTVTLDANELATVLGALRLFQREFEDREAFDIRESLPDHFAAGLMPLGTNDIDTLCERINMPSKDGTEDLSAAAKAAIIQAARDSFEAGSDDELEIDDNPKLSGSEDGVWVAAWVWVNKSEVLCSECHEPKGNGEGYDELCGNCADRQANE
jgi:hypothetical protein